MTITPRRTILPSVVAICFAVQVHAAEGDPRKVDSNAPRPVAQANELMTAPAVDGNVLDDPAWRDAEPITDFWQIQPNVGRAATQQTAVYFGFTEKAIYIGIVAYDDEPLEIISTDTRRDSSLDDTDSVKILIDGLLDRQNGYIFGTNPSGVEYDGQIEREGAGQFVFGGEGGFNLNWDAPWNVRSRVSDFGWSAEMEIPFTSLRYGRGEVQEWGVNIERRIRRNNEIAYWAPMSQDRTIERVSEAGSVQGIKVPRHRNLQFTPYILGSAGRGGMISGTDTNEEFGFDIKYSITPSLTLDATYNTDFAQVEVDDQQVNLDRFSLFFPEKRPFFLENAGQFTVGNPQEVELFFSRRIGIASSGEVVPIDGGLRLSGKVGTTTNVGLLFMQSQEVAGVAPENQYSVARVNQELRNRSSIGFLLVDREGNSGVDDENQTYAIDGRLGIGDNLLLTGYAAKTATPGLNGKDDAFSVGANYNDADWTMDFAYREVGGDFNPEVGFLTRSGYRRASGLVLRRIRPDNLWNLFEIRPHISYRGFWDFEGFQETGFLHMDSHWEFDTGTEIHTGVNVTREGVKNPFDIIPGVTIQPGTYDHAEVQLVFMGDQSQPLNFDLRLTAGGRFGGDRLSLEPTARYRVGEKFTSELAVVYNDFDLPVPGGQFTANLMKLRLSYSFTPKILLQLLTQYNEIDDVVTNNVRFSWLQAANAGLFLVYNEVDERFPGAPPRGREFIVKYSRIFDVLK